MSIEDYEFSDSEVAFDSFFDEKVVLIHKHKISPWFSVGKQDVIAMAKHFKLTEEDLK